MCDPVSLGVASLVIGVGSAVTSYASQSQQASSEAKESGARYRSVAGAALENYRFNLGQLGIRESQEFAAGSQAAVEDARRADAARGVVSATAAARGVGGRSVSDLLGEFSAIEAENNAAIRRNLLWSRTALSDQAIALRADTQRSIAAAAPSRVFGPSPLGLVFDIGAAGLKSYETYLKF